jgi:hypothetical protein
MDIEFLNDVLGPLPETDERHYNYHGSCDEAFTYSADAMKAERKRCYLLGLIAGQGNTSELLTAKKITPSEFELRGMFASKLKFWHLLTEEEAQSVVAVFEKFLSEAKSKEMQ